MFFGLNSHARLASRLLGGTSLGVVALMAPALAQDAAAPALETVTVTGTLIKGINPVGTNIVTVDTTNIQQRGLLTTDGFTFEGEDVDGRRIVVGSVQMLSSQLGDLNTATWKARGDEIEAWGRGPPQANAPLELQARYAFAVMSDLARRAVEHRLPMKLDY